MKFRIPRDPAFYTGLVAALVMALSTFFVHWSDESQGALNAAALFIAGAVTAWKTTDSQLALVVGAFKALMAVALSFGLHWTDKQQLAALLLVSAVATAFVRTQVSPKDAPPTTPAGLPAQ